MCTIYHSNIAGLFVRQQSLSLHFEIPLEVTGNGLHRFRAQWLHDFGESWEQMVQGLNACLPEDRNELCSDLQRKYISDGEQELQNRFCTLFICQAEKLADGKISSSTHLFISDEIITKQNGFA